MALEEGGSVFPVLTPLDRTHDNFEALLLLLLRAYTTQNHTSNTSSSLISSITGDFGISGEALDTLSSEQISALITSNSVNYEVIQHILAQQKVRPGGRSSVSPPGIVNGGSLSQLSPMDSSSASICAMIEETQRESSAGPSSPVSPKPPTAGVLSTSEHLQRMIQITPEQLNLLQTQVHGLLRSQNITLPSNLSTELIQTLLFRQLHLQQKGGVGNASLKDSTTPVSVPVTSSADIASGGPIAGTVLGGTVEGGSGKSGAAEREGEGGTGKGEEGGVGEAVVEGGETPVQAKVRICITFYFLDQKPWLLLMVLIVFSRAVVD